MRFEEIFPLTFDVLTSYKAHYIPTANLIFTVSPHNYDDLFLEMNISILRLLSSIQHETVLSVIAFYGLMPFSAFVQGISDTIVETILDILLFFITDYHIKCSINIFLHSLCKEFEKQGQNHLVHICVYICVYTSAHLLPIVFSSLNFLNIITKFSLNEIRSSSIYIFCLFRTSNFTVYR